MSDHAPKDPSGTTIRPCPICSGPGKRIPYDGLQIFGAVCTECGWFYSRWFYSRKRKTR